jgi:ubiquinone/menaquinone biosynthesis C-methylase UbiE
MSDFVDYESGGGHVCPHKIGFILDNWFRRLIQSPKKIVGEYIRRGDTVIDMGCGPGFFSIDMAKMVGEEGRVIAVDLQRHMLSKVRKKAEKYGYIGRMEFHQSKSNIIGLNVKADFILAYYMIHETPDSGEFLSEMQTMLKDSGRLLVVEPKIHVSQKEFEILLNIAEKTGLKTLALPKGKGGRSVLFGAAIAK